MRFIVFEGLDGSGKSTLIKGLEAYLQKKNVPFGTTREPGGTSLGEEIRRLLLRIDGEAPSPRTELLLYEAARSQHVDFVIRPRLEQKHWVLCDRFTASSLAFQAGARGLDAATVERLNEFATGGLRADLTVLLDLTVSESARRLNQREEQSGVAADRFELEDQQFHEKVRQAYLKIARDQADDWLVLDAALSKERLLERLLNELRRRRWVD